MSAGPPNEKRPARLSSRPTEVEHSKNAQRWHLVKRGGLRAWLEICGSISELATRDPQLAARYAATWCNRIRRGIGEDVTMPGVLASGGGQR